MDTYFDPLQFTINLRERIMKETGLPISFGLASNKLVAKIATNQSKPNGYLQIPHGSEASFLAPLLAEEIPGVGKSTLPILHGLGLFTIGDIAASDPAILEEFMGKWGSDLWNKSNGKSGSIYFSGDHESRSISAETTFEDTNDTVLLNKRLVRLTEKVCSQLRDSNMRTGCVAIKIRYNNFETFTRQTIIPDSYACLLYTSPSPRD